MKFYSYLLIFSFFLVSLVSVGQDLIPFDPEDFVEALFDFQPEK